MTAVKPLYFISQFNFYLKIKQDDINVMYKALTADYNPLDNNDVTTETVILNKSDKVTVKPSATKVSEFNKSYDGGLENTSYTQNEINSDAETTPSNSMSESFQNETQSGYNTTSKTLERKHGNISSITNQSIIDQEIELRMKTPFLNLIDTAVMHSGVYYDN